MIRINNLHIHGVGPIRDLNLSFDDKFNIICGQNGIGKTTILDCIAQSFAMSDMSIKKHALFEEGKWTISTDVNGESVQRVYVVDMFSPHERSTRGAAAGMYTNADEVIVFKTHRDIPYSNLGSITTDPKVDHYQTSLKTLNGTLSSDLKNWFVGRHLWSAHENHLDENQIANISLAKKCFGYLNPSVKFNRVDPSSNDILLETEDGEIYFEYLSSGYKSCLAVLIGLIKEIEFRSNKSTIKTTDFSGIVLIDEIDLHLHPEWQAKIYYALKEILPNAQIFTSTHSPHLIQIAEPSEIIPLIRGDDYSTRRNNLINDEFGCQGWSVEEILVDVMGMSETRSTKFNGLIDSFNKGLDDDDLTAAKSAYNELSRMLHPDSSLKKVLSIQLVGVGESD